MTIPTTSSFAPPQRPDSATLFKRTDANGDGKITKDELTTALESSPQISDGGQGPGADDLFSQLDADGDGAITETEHEAGLQKMDRQRGGPPPEASESSQMVDTLRKLLEALEKKNAGDATSIEAAAAETGAAATANGPTQASDNTDLSTLIEQLVAELKKNGDTTGVLRATA